ncbi:MAG: hypothetical protein LBJ01_02770 [Tannerella sp.]|nr:hypothetical protein [Tannerella sp.]
MKNFRDISGLRQAPFSKDSTAFSSECGGSGRKSLFSTCFFWIIRINKISLRCFCCCRFSLKASGERLETPNHIQKYPVKVAENRNCCRQRPCKYVKKRCCYRVMSCSCNRRKSNCIKKGSNYLEKESNYLKKKSSCRKRKAAAEKEEATA